VAASDLPLKAAYIKQRYPAAMVAWRGDPPGQADIIGKAAAVNIPTLIETARQLGLEKELAIAWHMAN
jgi:hypothetical protein